jgi:hypothetical protein
VHAAQLIVQRILEMENEYKCLDEALKNAERQMQHFVLKWNRAGIAFFKVICPFLKIGKTRINN